MKKKLRNYFDVWPSQVEYLRWSKVSKISFIGTLISVLVLIFTGLNFCYTYFIGLKIDSKQKNYSFEIPWDDNKASQQFFEILYTLESGDVFKLYTDGFEDTNKYADEDGECGFGEYQCRKGSYYGHGISGFFQVTLNGKNTILGLAYSGRAHGRDCHACAPVFSIIEYIQDGTLWKVKSIDPAVFRAGEWGLPTCDIDIVEIGYGAFAIRLKQFQDCSGALFEYTSFLTRIKDKYIKVFSIITNISREVMDEKPYNCSLDVKIVPIGTSYYEIRTFAEGSDKCPRVEEVYFFNGKEYTPKGKHVRTIFDHRDSDYEPDFQKKIDDHEMPSDFDTDNTVPTEELREETELLLEKQDH